MFLPTTAGVTWIQVEFHGGVRKKRSRLQLLHSFCDLHLVLLLSCHYVGCFSLNFGYLKLLFELSGYWYMRGFLL